MPTESATKGSAMRTDPPIIHSHIDGGGEVGKAKSLAEVILNLAGINGAGVKTQTGKGFV